MGRAGLPATTVARRDVAGDDRAGADEAPAPIVTPPRMTAPEPMRRAALDDRREQRPVVRGLQLAVVVRRARALVVDEHHAVPDEHLVLDRRRPSQTNVWLWILQRAPTDAPRWISTNGPIRVASPIRQP